MISEKIKIHTAPNHQQVEQNPVMQPLSGPSLTLEQYTTVLQKFYGFFDPLERLLNQVKGISAVLPDFADRRKASWLETDLAALPVPTPAAALLPQCQDLPTVETLGQALGCLYVLEGSTLGGRFIARSVREQLGIDEKNGGAFFQGYGPQTGSQWKAFLAALNTYHARHCQEEENILHTASETFKKLDQWLNQK